MNPSGGLLCSQMTAKTKEIACALGAGYKNEDTIWSQYVQQINKMYGDKKDRKEMYQGVPRNVPGSDTIDNFFSFWHLCFSKFV